MTRIHIERLDGASVPHGLGVTRNSPVPAHLRDAHHDAVFDARTLFYDCVYLADKKCFLVTAPQFGTLWPVFCNALRVNGRRPRRLWPRRSGRCDQVLVRGRAGDRLGLDFGSGERPIPVRQSHAAIFAGRNVVTAISRNNRPNWIAEWVRYHARVHGASGVILFDNGSDAYGLETLQESLQDIDGLEAGLILSAPFLYGDQVVAEGGRWRLKYLQVAVLNIARREAASKARAVLACDIDELVRPVAGGATVFDLACRHRLGAVQFGGAWIYPPEGGTLPCDQHVHNRRADPPRRCMPKWCARPDGLLSRLGGWNVHAVGGWFRQILPVTKATELMHCAGTTTAWKPKSVRFDTSHPIVEDAEIARLTAIAGP